MLILRENIHFFNLKQPKFSLNLQRENDTTDGIMFSLYFCLRPKMSEDKINLVL